MQRSVQRSVQLSVQRSLQWSMHWLLQHLAVGAAISVAFGAAVSATFSASVSAAVSAVFRATASAVVCAATIYAAVNTTTGAGIVSNVCAAPCAAGCVAFSAMICATVVAEFAALQQERGYPANVLCDPARCGTTKGQRGSMAETAFFSSISHFLFLFLELRDAPSRRWHTTQHTRALFEQIYLMSFCACIPMPLSTLIYANCCGKATLPIRPSIHLSAYLSIHL